ncbi:MAG: RNA polymerase sigma factor [Planctomycetaceae bacterium]
MTTNLSELSGLVDRHYAELYRYARRLSGSQADAEDLVQEAFLTLQAKGGQVRDPTARRAWLFRVVRNAYLQRVRSPAQAVTERLSDDLLRELCDPASLEPESLDFDSEALQQALMQLPEEYRSALLLHYFRGLVCREIAAHLQIPLGTVLSRISRGKAALRELLCPPPAIAGATAPGPQARATVSPSVPAPSATEFPPSRNDHE